MASSAQLDAAALVELLESADIRTVSDTQSLITENLQKGREAWLVNALVDSFMVSKSPKVVEILSNLQEPNEKYLFDRLADHLKGNNKLQSLELLAQIVRKQPPPWLHKIATHTLFFPLLIKVMKTELDVPILVTGLMAIAMLMPCMPLLIKPYLDDISDIYCRLVEFYGKKPAGQPDVYLLHLHGALYCLFHRLYGMYPCNFIDLVRKNYGKPEKKKGFQEIVKPMLDMVRLHPLVVFSTKDKEGRPERWKSKEVHDILVECADISLDLNEGLSEQRALPPSTLIKPTHPNVAMNDPNIMSPKQFTSAASQRSVKVEPLKLLGANQLVLAEQAETFWSPSIMCGLSTPPPGVNATPADFPSSEQSLGHLVVSEKTPMTITDSPYPPSLTGKIPQTPHEDSTEAKDDKFFETPDQRSKLLYQPQLSQSEKVDDQMNAELFTEQCLGVQRSQAVRKISFEEVETQMVGKGEADSQEMNSSAQADTLTSVPSVKQLSEFIDSLHVNAEAPDKEAVDEEVSELTREDGGEEGSTDSDGDGHPSHLPPSVEMTAASVKAFMQKVNRIKFNSMTSQRVSKSSKMSNRSESCPDLAEMDAQEEKEQEASDARFSSFHAKTRSSTNAQDPQSVGTVCTTTTTVTQVSATSTINQQTFNEFLEEMKKDAMSRYPYIELMPEVLPFLPFVQESDGKLDDIGPSRPLFTKYSPIDLLDKYMLLGFDVHEKELSQTSLASPGIPPVDEVSILKGQIHLLHNQLLYERNRRQIHAQRNRRLLKHIAKSTALEEQAVAQSDQLRLQESEMQNLRSALAKQQAENKALREIKEAFEGEWIANQRSAKLDIENLQKQNKHFKGSLEFEKKRNDSLKQELVSANAQIFSMTTEIENMRIRASTTEDLQRLVYQQNKELILSGELQQTYQQRLGEVSRSHQVQPETAQLAEALKAELSGSRLKAEQRLSALEVTKAKLSEAEEAIKHKDAALLEYKKLVEEQKTIHLGYAEAIEDKYRSQKAIQLTLQAQLLELENKVCLQQRPALGEISAPSSDEAVRRHPMALSPSRTSMSSAELADEALGMDPSTTDVSTPTSSAFQTYQRSPTHTLPSPTHALPSDNQS